MRVELTGLHWGRRSENGIWRASTARRRLLWRNRGAFYLALGRWRLRLVKPWVPR